jgi:hypothetical protein
MKKLRMNMLKLDRLLWEKGHQAMRVTTKSTAQFIQGHFHGSPKGFHDRTGALRASITGDYLETKANEIRGFVSAGDMKPGSEGIPNKAYAPYVEFGVNNPSTPFLRPGVLMMARAIKATFAIIMKVRTREIHSTSLGRKRPTELGQRIGLGISKTKGVMG